MDFTAPPTSEDGTDAEAIIVKADEVDEAGADISAISPSNTSSESDFNARIENRRVADAQTSSPKVLANAVPSPPLPLPRPILRRDGFTSAQPKQAPPPAPPKEEDKPTDSLSLQQLKKLVGELPKVEPTAYAYEYSETRTFPEEVQEWFVYSEEERLMLLRAKEDFEEKWGEKFAIRSVQEEDARSWIQATEEDRKEFVKEVLKLLEDEDAAERVRGLECLSYIALGAWGDTVGAISPADLEKEKPQEASAKDDMHETLAATASCQLEWISNGVQLLMKLDAVQAVMNTLKKLWESEQDAGEQADLSEEAYAEMKLMQQLEANHALTTLYLIVEVSRTQTEPNTRMAMRRNINETEPNVLLVLTRILAKLRWEETSEASCTPRNKVLLLFWKCILVVFGDRNDVEESKQALKRESSDLRDEEPQSFITASPLDYHLFRQEITSKYPTYSPPPPLLPIEPENNTILPPLPNHHSRRSSHHDLNHMAGGAGVSTSIFNQPVHIATPAPSPPPSPAGPGGKGAKKQNYQTNQNFPFLFPPLDDGHSDIGGKESAEMPNKLASRRWQGGNVPTSILEAGHLFASRMRMSRSLRQLWDVRERYIKEERGWSYVHGTEIDDNDDDGHDEDAYDNENKDDDHSLPESDQCIEEKPRSEATLSTKKRPGHVKETENEAVQSRLDAVDDYYRGALPDLQSLVIVLWKELFQKVSALGASLGPSNGADEGNDAAMKRKTNPNSSASLNALANGHLERGDGVDAAIERLDDVRIREISSKAVSGILLIMLKWFKLSHILKYEYLTQLLLDANYLPLVLKFFAHQDIDTAVVQKNDRADLDFFTFCHNHSKHPPASPPQPALSPSDSDSSDEGAPPPIRQHRRSPSESPPSTPPLSPTSKIPEVDELGFPTAGTSLPQSPLTDYAPRFFLTNINLLRLLQKITKRKAHRALLLVQYKSSTILRKALKIPQPDLRLYTLKLFKSQVPYCGRKWRQSNMRVITAIYLHCRPELRDEWLCGGDVDGVVEEAVPIEQAGRALVHWWHLRYYRDVMEGKAGVGGKKEEYDFFARELERMGWGGGELGSVDGETADQVPEGAEFDGGSLRMEGWA